MPTETTTNLGLPLPHVDNTLAIDVARLRSALAMIDTALFGKATPTDITNAITALGGGAPAALNTLNKLAAALSNDANYAATITAALATKLTQTQGDARYLQIAAAFTQALADARYAAIADGITTAERAKVAATANDGAYTFRNRLLNGSMAADQRFSASAATITAGAALAYTVDRWYAYCTGANVTAQQVSGSGATKRLQFTGAASNTLVGFGQRIEALNCLDMAGGNAVLQAKMVASTAKTVTWTAYYANTRNTFGSLASPTRTQIATGTFSVTTSEQTFTATFAVPSAASTGIEIVFTVPTLLGSQTLTVGDIQLERGTTATAIEVRPAGLELALCQRYFCTSNGNLEYHTLAAPDATFASTYRVTFPVQMRVAPTWTPNYNTSNAIGTYQVLATTAQYVIHYITASANTNAFMYFSWTADAEL